MIKPRALRPGDRIAAISLSSGWPSVYPGAYNDGKRHLEDAFGVQVVESRHALADSDWLAAHPEVRAADLMEVLRDPSIHGVVSTIGDDDSIRILPMLDLSVIRDNRKVFVGYSDATVTHFAFLKAPPFEGSTTYACLVLNRWPGLPMPGPAALFRRRAVVARGGESLDLESVMSSIRKCEQLGTAFDRFFG
jgi:muramoyltetrapeptide carboxypeptidase LdcA involved in peptidoglycan recycling